MNSQGDIDTSGSTHTDALSLSLYLVTLVARERLDLPAYLGSTLRGAFGHVFRAIACPGRFGHPCPIPNNCPYHLIFETAPPPDSQALRTHEEVPRPFVIAPITNGSEGWMERGRHVIEPGGEVSFGLTLIGRAQEYFPYFVVAFREIDRLGRRPAVGQASSLSSSTTALPPPSPPDTLSLTRERARERVSPQTQKTVELRRIDILDPFSDASWTVYDATDNLVHSISKPLTLAECAAAAPPASDRLTLEFLTQTRLKHDGGWARVPAFQIVFRRLLGRLSSLSRFHCGVPLDVDFKSLIEKAGHVRLLDNQTRWVSWTRYSNRQHQRMQWAGLIGKATYEGDLKEFWPWLKFGQSVHVGKGATFGLGKYTVV